MELTEKTWSYINLTAQAEETIRSSVLIAQQYPKKSFKYRNHTAIAWSVYWGWCAPPAAGSGWVMRSAWKKLLRNWWHENRAIGNSTPLARPGQPVQFWGRLAGWPNSRSAAAEVTLEGACQPG